jgi:prepilin-type N-terminal cleavage/methylation domain-containing protein
MKPQPGYVCRQGFSLIEMMIALSTIAIGLVAASQLLYIASASNSLARAKSTAILAAQDALESLGALYRQNPEAPDLSLGEHGPRSFEVRNPANGAVLNRYAIHWVVETLSDPRPGKILQARSVRTTVTPVTEDEKPNHHAGLNKMLSVATVFSQDMP